LEEEELRKTVIWLSGTTVSAEGIASLGNGKSCMYFLFFLVSWFVGRVRAGLAGDGRASCPEVR
jgi:hypothetical protein